MKTQTLRVRGGVVRIAAWHGRNDIASLALRGRGSLAPAAVDRVLARIRAFGFREVVTNALAPAASVPFVDAGFSVRSRLHVLVHDLEGLGSPTGTSRRARRSDRDEILAVDAAAFDEFWRLDDAGLSEAARATPSSHTRVVAEPVRGYVLLGRAAGEGYLQRLAVHPAAQGQGLGRALVADGLAHLCARGARRAYVNTQVENDRAFALYRGLGFEPVPVGLCVLGKTL